MTALRKNNEEGVKVYTKHQDLTQASKHHKQMTMSYSPLRRVSASSLSFLSSGSFSSSSVFLIGGGLYSITALRCILRDIW